MQTLSAQMTTWHITWGTYGSRLHGSDRPTVDRKRNRRGQPFVVRNDHRERFESNIATTEVVYLTLDHRCQIESVIPAMCRRGGWGYRIAAVGPECDHVHVLCDIDPNTHGKDARKWMKRWLSESLNQRWPRVDGQRWWVQGGSTRPVKEERYLNNEYEYLNSQRATS